MTWFRRKLIIAIPAVTRDAAGTRRAYNPSRKTGTPTKTAIIADGAAGNRVRPRNIDPALRAIIPFAI
jgi:hypothetical protein